MCIFFLHLSCVVLSITILIVLYLTELCVVEPAVHKLSVVTSLWPFQDRVLSKYLSLAPCKLD